MRVHWFNPENDLALAAGMQNFTPPKAAVQIHDSGALLPLWYASAGDKVLCYGVNAQWLDRMQRDFDIDVDVFDHTPTPDTVPDPWGWSRYAKHILMYEGFLPETLPTDRSIVQMRQLSHRRTASLIAYMLKDRLPALKIGEAAAEVTDIDTVNRKLTQGNNLYIKHPWSGSGRGVLCTADAGIERSLKFADDSLRRQGSVMIEPAYNRVIDFARLYECVGGRCIDLGTSVFTTDQHHAYTGNVLSSEDERVRMVSRYFGEDELTAVAGALREIIEIEVAQAYDGIVGVDMLIADDGTLAIVEVNLRKTMGYVAARFSDMYLAPGSTGVFRVGPSSSAASAASSYQVAEHRIVSGTLHLTPPGFPFSFTVEVY